MGKLILFYFCLIGGTFSVADTLVYIIMEQHYKKHPDTEKSFTFEVLDVVFRHKFTRVINIISGVVLIAAAVVIYFLPIVYR